MSFDIGARIGGEHWESRGTFRTPAPRVERGLRYSCRIRSSFAQAALSSAFSREVATRVDRQAT
jgi:hypothetical protein